MTSRVSPHAFAPQTSRYSVLENAPAHHPARRSGARSGTAPSGSPPVRPGDVAAAVAAYLSTTAGMIDLFDNATLLDDLLLWADQPRKPPDGASTIKYLVLAIGRLTDDEALAQEYFEHARNQAYVDMSGDLSAETVQSFVLITVYMLCSCQINGAFLFFGIAARAAYSIGVHRTEVNARFGEAVHRQRDNLWKSLRAVDLFLSTSMGRPPATSDIDCTVSYRALDDDGNDVFDLLNASVQILLITETIVIEIYSRRKISLQLTEGISLQLRGWSDRWLQQLKDVITQPGATDDEAQLSGACQVLSTYYYSVMLVSRPFLMYELYRRLSDAPGAAARGTALPSGKTKLADACIDAASLMVDPVLDLIEQNVLNHRAPMLVSWLFAASLVLGVGLLGGFGRILEKYTRMSIQALDHFAETDGHATQYSLIAQSLLTTALEDLERRELQERLRRTESSSQLFGLMPHDTRMSLGGNGSGSTANSPRDTSNLRAATLRTPATGRPSVSASGPAPASTGADSSGVAARSDQDASPMPWQTLRNRDRQTARGSIYGGGAAAPSPRIGDIDSAFLGLSESMLHTPDADYWSNSFGVNEADGGAGSAINLFPLLDAGGGIDLAHYL